MYCTQYNTIDIQNTPQEDLIQLPQDDDDPRDSVVKAQSDKIGRDAPEGDPPNAELRHRFELMYFKLKTLHGSLRFG